MENKPLYVSVVYRIMSLMLDGFFIYGLMLGILEKEIALIIVFGLGLILFLVLTILIFVNYIFNEYKIVIRIPFIGEKEYLIEDIIGYVILKTSKGSNLIIYKKDKHYSIQISGKNIRKAVYDFMENNYERILIKNQEELKDRGIFIQMNKKRQMHFFCDCLEIITNGNKVKHSYKELKPKYLGEDGIKLNTENNKKIHFSIYQCKGQFGLFEYLMKYEWKNE
jgi:flagellar motor component MotA